MPRPFLRPSVVFRSMATKRIGPSGQQLKGNEQKCAPVSVPEPETTQDALKTPDIERKHVHELYDAIAEHWSHTRYKPWPKVTEFIKRQPQGSLFCDVGAGNGKNMFAINEVGMGICCDISAPLVEICKRHGFESLVCDGLLLPYRGVFDAVVHIAVMHHLSTHGRRVEALRAATRLLKPGGQLLVYGWAQEQDGDVSRSRHRFPEQDVMVPWHHRTNIKMQKPLALREEGKEGIHVDGEKKEEKKEEEAKVFDRYCHVYVQGEMEELFSHVTEAKVLEVYYDTGNWAVIAERVPDGDGAADTA